MRLGNRSNARCRSSSAVAALACILLASAAQAQVCGDADGDGQVSVTDGVNVLRAAAGLPGACPVERCDVDGNGTIGVGDGVNVLRVAAGLPATLACTPQARFVDNGDGTVTDNETGLQWEKKTGVDREDFSDCSVTACPDPHDVNNRYQWCFDADHSGEGRPDPTGCDDPMNPPNGGAFTDFLVTLNTPPCFATHCDWRLPTVGRDGAAAELETIFDVTASGCGRGDPCIDPIFGPTAADPYWSATTDAEFPDAAWDVEFDGEGVGTDGSKNNILYVRAVRTLP